MSLAAAGCTSPSGAVARVFENPPGEARPARALHVAFGAPSPPAAFSIGWSAIEPGAPPFRWSVGKHSRVDVHFRPDDVPYLLELRGHSMHGGPSPQSVAVTLNGKPVGTITPDLQPRTQAIRIPPGVLRSGRNTFDLSYAWTRKASERIPGSTDDRDLGVAIERMSIVPASAQVSLDVGDPSARPALSSGFGPDVLDPQGSFSALVEPCGKVELFAALSSAPSFLRVRAGAAADGDMSVAINGVLLGSARIGTALRTKSFDVPVGTMKAGGNRLELCAKDARIDSIALEPANTALDIDLGTTAGPEVLGAGWSVPERGPDRGFVWSNGARSQLDLVLGPNPGAYELRLSGRAVAPGITAEILLNGRSIGKVTSEIVWTDVALRLEPGALVRGSNELVFVFSQTVRPSNLTPGSTDTRDLAFALSRVALSPS